MPLQAYTGDYSTSELYLRNGALVIPIWVPKGGFITRPFPAEIHSMKRLSEIAEISAITPEFLNEREAFGVGRQRATLNDGVAFTATLTLEGNALLTKMILAGKDSYDYPAIAEGQTFTASGHLFLLGARPDQLIEHATVLMDCDVKMTDVAGATDGQSTMTLELTTRSSVLSTTGQVIPFKETWFDGTSPKDGTTAIVNAAAPDGVLTTFALGTGNHSGLAVVPLAAKINEAAAGSANEYILSYRVNGSESTAFTYNSATGVITPSSVLPAETKLEVVYFLKVGAPAWSNTKAYGVGQVVQYNGAYYVSSAASTGTTPTGSAPWLAYTGFAATSGGTPVVPFNAANKFDFLKDWKTLIEL